MQLRDYQIDLKKKTYDAFKKHDKVMAVLPTGAGKTILFVDMINDIVNNGHKVMVLVHRKELIDQTISKLFKRGIRYSVIQSEYDYYPFEKVQIASVPTLVRRISDRPGQLPKDIKLIICDEAHHSTAASYRKIYDFYSDSYLLGVTATPIRTSGEGFDDIFDELVNGVTVKQLIEMGFLVKPKIFAKPLNFDLSQIRKTAGDYNDKDIFEAMEANTTYGDYVSSWRQKADGMKTIVFAINTIHSQKIVEAYNQAGIRAEHIDAKTPKNERDDVLNRFRQGITKVVSNVGIVTEGFDVPSIECVQLARPTKSLSLYLQMIGRGLRPLEGKNHAVVLDHANNVFEHGFPEQDRAWTLKGIQKPKVQKSILIKAEGSYYTPRELPDHINDIELEEVEFDQMRWDHLMKLLDEAKRRRFKPGYAWHKFLKKHQIPTEIEIDKFCQVAGYDSRWTYYTKKDFKLIA